MNDDRVSPPELAAYRLPLPGDCRVIYCRHCQRWHNHGLLGHRVAHCILKTSPYRTDGYTLIDAGEATPAILADVRRLRARGVPSGSVAEPADPRHIEAEIRSLLAQNPSTAFTIGDLVAYVSDALPSGGTRRQRSANLHCARAAAETAAHVENWEVVRNPAGRPALFVNPRQPRSVVAAKMRQVRAFRRLSKLAFERLLDLVESHAHSSSISTEFKEFAALFRSFE